MTSISTKILYGSLGLALATTPAWADHREVMLEANATTSYVGFAQTANAAGDVNCDGFDDIIVGAPGLTGAAVFYGSATGRYNPLTGSANIPDWAVNPDFEFGFSVSAAGDVNGDNCDDVIIGAHQASNGSAQEGRAYVYHGSPSGLATTPAWIAESDQANAWFGYSVSTAGDVNGDGYDDVIIGGYRYDDGENDEGIAMVFFGSATGLPDADDDGIAHPGDAAWQATGNLSSANFGEAVATAGDVNGDGYDDIVIGAPGYQVSQFQRGKAFVYFGSPSGPTSSGTADWSAELGGDAGQAVATAGDVNNDGYDDIIVGAPGFGNGQQWEGGAYVYLGSATGPRNDGNHDWRGEGNQDNPHGTGGAYGISVAGAGDTNNDGYDDIIVGFPFYDNGEENEGAAFIYYGSATGPALSADVTAESNQAGASLGAAVSSAGDVENDGVADYLVAAPDFSHITGASTFGELTGSGAAFAYLSSPPPAHIDVSPHQLHTTFHLTGEDGATSAFTLVLNSQPTADVVIDITSNDPGEGAVSPAVLTFTPDDWDTAQTVTISGVDDVVDDGDITYTLSITSTSGDPDYDGLITNDITVKNADDDSIAIIVEPTVALVTTEDGGTATFTVTLDAQPTADVTVDLSSSDTTEGTVSPSSLTFTPTDFRTPQTVTITGQDDAELDGNVAYTIVTAAAVSADNRYHGLAPEDVSVTNHDDDAQFALTVLEGNQAGALYGRSLNPAGDINGDGHGDFIVGAPKHDDGQTNEGRAWVYFGSASGVTAAPWTAEGDLINAHFGWSVDGAGDVNGDGYDDIIIGAYRYSDGETDEGRAYLYLGSASGLAATPVWTAQGDQDGANFGDAVGGAGDVNGDGYDDIIVGAPHYANGQSDEGRVYLYFGSATGPAATADWTMEIDTDFANFGDAVGSAGDVNNDSYDDIIIAASKYVNQPFSGLLGRTYVYYGSATGPEATPWIAEGSSSGDGFGVAAASAGDINGDGFDDVIIGADGVDDDENNEGQLYLFYGSASGLPATADWTAQSNQADSKLGITAAGAGDIDGDGFDDIIAGASRYDQGETDEGRAFVYFGSATGPGNPVTLEIDQAFAYFGSAVASADDVDGDGFADFIVGATSYDGDLTNEGGVFLYLSNRAGINVNPVTGLTTTESGGNATFTVVLTNAPTDNVTLGLSSDDTTEGTVNPTTLTFTTGNWSTPQTVTITGVDDSDVDGDVAYTILTAPATSADTRYDGLNANDVSVVNTNDDAPTVTVSATVATITEGDTGSAIVTVTRTGGTPSSLNVFYTVDGTATNGDDYVTLSGTITIPAGSSNTDIPVTPLIDGAAESNETVIITLTPDSAYNVGANADATVTINDNTTPGITVSPTAGLTTTEAGGTDTFTVVLDSQPTADVTLGLTSDDAGEGRLIPESLIFTAADWNIPQTVTVVGQDDTLIDGDIAYGIVTAAAMSADSDYNGLNPDDISVTNRDDEELPLVTLIATDPDTNESGASAPGTFTVFRSGDVSSSLTVNYSVSGTATSGVDYVALSGTVTLAAGNDSAAITVSTLNNLETEGEETVVVTLTNDAAYIVGTPGSDTVTIRDDIGTLIPPVVNFAPDQIVAEGSTVSVPIVRDRIGGTTSITYSVSGSAVNPDDHNAVSGTATIVPAATIGHITFDVIDDGLIEGEESVVFVIETVIENGVLGPNPVHVVTLSEDNLLPAASLIASQNGLETRLITTTDGNVTIVAAVTDPNPADTHSYDWSLTNNNLVDIDDGDPATFVFDPTTLLPGFYSVRLSVSDDGTPALTVDNELLLEITTSAPALSTVDSDKDGVFDDQESFDDNDSDGVPDYLDAGSLQSNELQQLPLNAGSYIMRTEAGLVLRLGDVSFAAGSDSAQVTPEDIASYGGGEGNPGIAPAEDTVPNVGGYFDFEIAGLPTAGQSANVVIPQLAPIPNGARYRKYDPDTGWRDFQEDTNNALSSAPGEPGQCPPPGDSAYTSGLTADHHCLQLTLEDGGPNDMDGIANHVIEDPGQLGATDDPEHNDSGDTSNSGIGAIDLAALVVGMLVLAGRRFTSRRCMH